MESGGVSKSMSTLLNVIDANRFEIDLLMLNPTGVFMKLLPNTISVISDVKTQLFFSKFPHNLILLLNKGYFFAAVLRLIAAIVMIFNKGIGGKILSKGIIKISKKYDLAVDYNGQHQLYYLVDFINAKVKVSFFHNDYLKWDYYYFMDKKYYPKVNKIYTISEICVQSLKKHFPNQAGKIDLFENISSLNVMERLAEAPIELMPANAIVTVGHLVERKGTLLALECAVMLKKSGLDFKWYFVGQNTHDHDYVGFVQKYGLQENIVFVGVTSNPYPYLKKATIIVHTAYFEGKSIALDEAKLFCKPIVVTNFSTVNDQFTHGYNATIVPFDSTVIAQNVIVLLTDKNLQKTYKEHLKKDRKSNEDEIEKLYRLI